MILCVLFVLLAICAYIFIIIILMRYLVLQKIVFDHVLENLFVQVAVISHENNLDELINMLEFFTSTPVLSKVRKCMHFY